MCVGWFVACGFEWQIVSLRSLAFVFLYVRVFVYSVDIRVRLGCSLVGSLLVRLVQCACWFFARSFVRVFARCGCLCAIVWSVAVLLGVFDWLSVCLFV